MLLLSSTYSRSSTARLRLARFPRLQATQATHGCLPSYKRQRSTATPYATPYLLSPSCTLALGARARTYVPTYVCCTLPLDSSAPFCALTSPLRTPTQLSARCICLTTKKNALDRLSPACLLVTFDSITKSLTSPHVCQTSSTQYTAIQGITRTLHGHRCCPSAWTSTSTNACNAISVLPQQSPSHRSGPLTMRTRSSNTLFHFDRIVWPIVVNHVKVCTRE